MIKAVENYEIPEILTQTIVMKDGGSSSGGSGGYDGLAQGCGPFGGFGGRNPDKGKKNK